MSDLRPGAREGEGGELLSHLSNEMVRAKKRFFGKGPEKAKSYLLDDILIVVMRGGLTTAEQTMKSFGQYDMIRQFRQLFENEMTDHLTALVAEATGREVVTYQSQILFDPDVIIEIFVFAGGEGDPAAVAATARGQLAVGDVGEATDTDLPTPPPGSTSPP
jgi:uncharacterized protein YbcI